MSKLARLARDRGGNVAIPFALVVIPVLVLTGAGVDFTQATRVRSKLQSATDSAALALARNGLNASQSDLNKIAKAYISANYDNKFPANVSKVTLDKATVTAEINTSASVPTTFLGLAGMKTIPVSVRSVAKGLSVEIAMVLDTSYSMNDVAGSTTKIAALKEASTALLDTMFGASSLSQRFTISIVPFSSSVNVGTGKANAAWMDNAISTTTYWEDFDKKVNRLTMFNSGAGWMKNISWGGCVIIRKAPNDVDDTVPAVSDPQTLFIPWFAPDEPDDPPTNQYYGNSYLVDTGGNCMPAKSKATLNAETQDVKQKRTCKYAGATPTVSFINVVGTYSGPNFLCDATPVTPLTNTRATLNSAVNALQGKGTTNILEGFTWGWRTLSPTEPFTEGKAYGAANNSKVMIVMTDGENFVGSLPNTLNLSAYSAYGFMSKGRLKNPGSTDEAANTAAANTKVLAACTKAKAKKIVIYTIAFGAAAAGSQSMLQSCATSAAYFYAPQKASDLKPVFVKIAQQINQLRIAQ